MQKRKAKPIKKAAPKKQVKEEKEILTECDNCGADNIALKDTHSCDRCGATLCHNCICEICEGNDPDFMGDEELEGRGFED